MMFRYEYRRQLQMIGNSFTSEPFTVEHNKHKKSYCFYRYFSPQFLKVSLEMYHDYLKWFPSDTRSKTVRITLCVVLVLCQKRRQNFRQNEDIYELVYRFFVPTKLETDFCRLFIDRPKFWWKFHGPDWPKNFCIFLHFWVQ